MKILGVHYGHDSCAAIIDHGEAIYAVSEERLNRKKFHRGFPFLSIQAALDYTGFQPEDIDHVSLVNRNAQEETLGGSLKNFYKSINRSTPWHAKFLNGPVCALDNLFGFTLRRRIARDLVLSILEGLGFPRDKVAFTDHHFAHAAGAFFLSGFKDALVITSDGKGDHVSHRTYTVRNNKYEMQHESQAFDSAGFFYSCITAYLGFKKLRHEGKITGLAAYGNFDEVKHISSPLGLSEDGNQLRNFLIPEKEARNIFQVYWRMLGEDPALLYRWVTSFSAVMSEYSQYRFDLYYKDQFKNVAREHVASFAQKHLEDTVSALVENQIRKHGIADICLSGGTFGNVRLNQKIAELQGVGLVYVQPAMGDGGLAVGGALWEYWSRQSEWRPDLLRTVFLGPDYPDSEIEAALKKYNLFYEKVDRIEKRIVDALMDGKVVARYTGRMEWGPRAQGNRTILATALDPGINKELNDRLKRTEFMPFAPIILEEFADQYLRGYRPEHLAGRFMTITYDVMDDKQAKIPAVVHVDGTARPQVVRHDECPSLYTVLREYYGRTEIPALINTSFNMHEEPIVCTPDDAVRAFLDGGLDVLAIENYFIEAPLPLERDLG